MIIEDRLSVMETEKRLSKIDIPRCKNCEHYHKPICTYSLCYKKVSENDWCNNWEEDK